MSRPKAISLHGLRWKIAAAALAKRAGRSAGRTRAGRSAVEALQRRLHSPGEEPTGSYRSILADLLSQALPDESCSDSVICDPVAGLVQGPAVQIPETDEVIERAEQKPHAGNLIAAAAALRKPYVGDLHTAVAYYERAFETNPHDLRAVEGLLTTGARTHFDWPRIWASVQTLKPRSGRLKASSDFWRAIDPLFAEPPDPVWVRQARVQLLYHQAELPGVHQLLLEAIAMRLQFLGHFVSAAGVRSAMAENRCKELRGIPLESALWLKHLLGAYAYLEQDRALVTTVIRPRLDTSDRLTRIQAEKLRADVNLLLGSRVRLQEHAAARRSRLRLSGDELMESLVTGARIAVVGPAVSDEDLGELIESYDVVVRTRHRVSGDPARVGKRTDIAYFSGRDLLREYDDAAAAAERGDFQLAVARPFLHEVLNEQPQWLRCAQFEYGLYFRGAALGIQRIIYDLLQFAPAEIAVFHADFYAGSVASRGYRAEGQRFGPDSVLNDVVAVHDLLTEFRWTQRIYQAGLVTAHGVTAEVLSLSAEDYLRRLEEGPLGHAGRQRPGTPR